MNDLKRVVYTSEAIGLHKDGKDVSGILSKSASNNEASGITGILVQFDGLYLQVLEGKSSDVDALVSRIQKDSRHRGMQIRLSELVSERMFGEWAMAHPSLTDKQINIAIRLLTSDSTSSQNVGLNFLKYWQTTQTLEKNAEYLPNKLRIDELNAEYEGGMAQRAFSRMSFFFFLLLAVLVDVGFFVSNYVDGISGSTEMLQSYAVAIVGLVLSMLALKRGVYNQGIVIFQAAALVTVGMQALYVGYGIYAPTLPYLGLAIASGVMSNRPDKNHRLMLACSALIGLTAILSLSSATAASFTRPVASHHMVIAALLFPLICALLLNGQQHDRATTERFSTRLLADLTDTVADLKKAMAAKNYFFSAISHEIRTPMNGALLAVTLIQNPKAKEDAKSRGMKALHHSLSSLNRLLEDLLDISKLGAGKFELTPEVFDINEATQAVLELFTPAIEEGGNTLSTTLLGQPLRLIGDRLRYQQMLSNLLSNAVKFTKGGNIAVCLRLEAQSSITNVFLWRLEVSDTGVGIPLAEIGKLFQPFSQASQHGFTQTKGTGLGLAIVGALAKQMGGDAGVSSSEGKGSTFWFTFNMPLH